MWIIMFPLTSLGFYKVLGTTYSVVLNSILIMNIQYLDVSTIGMSC